MQAKVILNPYASRWKAGQRRGEIEAALHSAGVDHVIAATDQPGHATELARQAVLDGFNPILTAGGDGTIGEVVNGILPVDPEGQVVFGMLPVGTANDLADNLGWPKDLAAAAQAIAAGNTKALDVCSINGHYFVNNAGLGLEPHVSIIQAGMKRLKGNFRYLAAALRGIMDNPQWEMEMTWDDGEYRGQVTLVSIGNCARTGGIFYTVPHADPFDGQISFIYGHVPTRLKLLAAFPMIMKPGEGNVSEHPAVHEIHTTQLHVRVPALSPAQADGEVITEGDSSFEFRVLPGRLSILSA